MEIRRKGKKQRDPAAGGAGGDRSAAVNRHTTFQGTGASAGKAAPDFQELLAAIQRRDVHERPVAGSPPPPTSSQARNHALVFQPQSGQPYAVVLAKVTGVGRMPSNRQRGGEPPPPLATRVLSGICEHDAEFVWLLFGAASEVHLVVGVKATGATEEAAIENSSAAFNSLQTCLTATYPEIRVSAFGSANEYREVLERLASYTAAASLMGNPSADNTGENDQTTTDCVIRAIRGSHYCLFVQADPIKSWQLSESFWELTRAIAEAHEHVKHTASASTTSVSQQSVEQVDRFAQHCEELLEIAFGKVEAGLREGMWRASVTLLTRTACELHRSGALLRSVLAGSESKPEPIHMCFHERPAAALSSVSVFASPSTSTPHQEDGEMVHLGAGPLRTPLCSSDLGLLVDLPRDEAPGYRVTRPRRFALDIDPVPGRRVNVGRVISASGETNRVFSVPLDDLSRHALVVGVTGSGKTNTALQLVHQLWVTHHVPFLVIEPAKAQYRHLLAANGFEDLQIFAPGLYERGLSQVAPLRINPFEFPVGIDPQAHISHLYTVFNAAFILYAPMPYVLERSLYEVYEGRGWDFGVGGHPESDSTTGEPPPLAFPTVSDLYDKIGDVVGRLGYDRRIRMDVTAGLQARVDSLRVGHKGQTFDCRRSVPMEALLAKPTILELSHLGNDEERAFLMGLLLMRLYENRMLGGDASGLRHVTLIEEAHRLLARTNADTSAPDSANTKGQSVEAFCNILAEIRAYGEGLIVAEQIPSKLAHDVVKNTNLKIMHRVVAADDRELMGGTMNLMSQQKMAVTALERGRAAVFAEGSESPALVAVPLFRTAGVASNEDVKCSNEEFYRSHPRVLRQMPGCTFCSAVCRHGAIVKRRALTARAAAVFWGFVAASLEGPLPEDVWDGLARALIGRGEAFSLSAEQRDNLVWCQFATIAEQEFWFLRRRGVPLADLETLLECLSRLADAVRRKHAAHIASLTAEFRSAIMPSLHDSRGPWRGCARCRRPCLYQPLGRLLSERREFVSRLHAAFQQKPAQKSVASVCRQFAAEAVFTTHAPTVEGVAVCLFAHVAERVGSRDPAGNIAVIFQQ
ncbi:MAG: helicase HerA domain-containing protein [Planctomycetota bacterium]